MEKQEDTGERSVFSQPWNGSDVVLVVEEKEFHVHRYILSLQSPVFKAMFNGNFRDAKQDKIELEDDKYEAMLEFLKLLYPATMFDEDNLNINDKNILRILEVADKYAAINVIKQCMKETERIRPINTMRLLPYAARHKLPLEKIVDVTVRHVSTEELERFSPELSDQSVYINTLLTKCRLQEKIAEQTYTTMLDLVAKYVAEVDKGNSQSLAFEANQPVRCVPHRSLGVRDFREARKCEKCLVAYKTHFIDEYVYPRKRMSWLTRDKTDESDKSSVALIQLLKDMDDIATSLKSQTLIARVPQRYANSSQTSSSC